MAGEEMGGGGSGWVGSGTMLKLINLFVSLFLSLSILVTVHNVRRYLPKFFSFSFFFQCKGNYHFQIISANLLSLSLSLYYYQPLSSSWFLSTSIVISLCLEIQFTRNCNICLKPLAIHLK